MTVLRHPVANAIPLSTVTAKGDTIVATGASTVTNLPIGGNGTTLIADSSNTSGVRWGDDIQLLQIMGAR